MHISLIWAQAANGAIGVRNTLPWHIPEDLKAFKSLTQGKPVLMGRKTWESLPFKPLPNRTNIVITSSKEAIPGAMACSSFESALERLQYLDCAEAFVIGGAQVYAKALDHADTVWVTVVERVVPDADTFAPTLAHDTWIAAEVRRLAPGVEQTRFVRHPDKPKMSRCRACMRRSFFKRVLTPVMRHQDASVAVGGWGLDRVQWVCSHCGERHC